MKNNVLAALLLMISCALFSSAQEDKSTDQLSYLFPEPQSWSYGVQLNQGKEFFPSPNIDGFNFSEYRLEAMFYADYRLNEKSSLRGEFSYRISGDHTVGVNAIYNYKIADRWEVFGGLGVTVNSYAWDDSLYNDPALNRTHFNMTGILGLRYHASKNIFLDLRYTRQLLSPVGNTNATNNPGRSNSVTLGVGLKF